MITKSDIDRLFIGLWQNMHDNQGHRRHCTSDAIFNQIHACFKKYGKDFNGLLDCLSALDGIGLTLASGLIWSVYEDEAVPFDKYTMCYSINEERGILKTMKISGGKYEDACKKVLAYMNREGMDSIEEYVRIAGQDVHCREYVKDCSPV